MSDTHEKAMMVPGDLQVVPAQTVSPLAMVQTAVEKGLEPELIGKLMDLADRHQATEAKNAFTRALVGLKRDLPTVIGRDKLVAYGKTRYTHSSLAAVMEAVTEPLAQHGFSLSWDTSTDSKNVTVTCYLTHAQGHSETTTLSSVPDASGNKSPAQQIASTITLLERYTALARLGIATADMEEPEPDAPKKDDVNTAMNMRAVRAVVDAGRTKADAEKLLGKELQQWTVEDLKKLKAWLAKDSNNAETKADAEQEPPHNPETGEVIEDKYDYGPPPLTDEEVAEMRGNWDE